MTERPTNLKANEFQTLWLGVLLLVLLQSGNDISAQETQPGGSVRPVILRDLTVIPDQSVVAFDDNVVQLSDGTLLSWDQVFQAEVPGDLQDQFQRRLSQIGLPLFRIRSRLANSDWASISEIAEPMYAAVFSPDQDAAGFEFGPDIQYLICLATMYGRIEHDRRADAIEPFLFAAALQPSAQVASQYPEIALTQDELDQLICHRILPVWFDADATETAYVSLSEAINSERIPRRDGVLIYVASLAVAAGDSAGAVAILESPELNVPGLDSKMQCWVQVVQAARLMADSQVEQGSRLIRERDSFAAPCRAVALYLAGTQTVATESSHTAMLSLLAIPALFGDTYKDLSAAALYRAAELAKKNGDAKGRQNLINELLARYPGTYHGRRTTEED